MKSTFRQSVNFTRTSSLIGVHQKGSGSLTESNNQKHLLKNLDQTSGTIVQRLVNKVVAFVAKDMCTPRTAPRCKPAFVHRHTRWVGKHYASTAAFALFALRQNIIQMQVAKWWDRKQMVVRFGQVRSGNQSKATHGAVTGQMTDASTAFWARISTAFVSI